MIFILIFYFNILISLDITVFYRDVAFDYFKKTTV
jgi:hypothetical protein